MIGNWSIEGGREREREKERERMTERERGREGVEERVCV